MARHALAMVVLAAAVLAVAAAPSAAESARMRLGGQVIDATGTPIGGVVVFAMDEATGAVSASVRSGRDGRFVLDVPPKKHKLGVSSMLFQALAFDEEKPGEVRLFVTARPLELGVQGGVSLRDAPSVVVSPSSSPPPPGTDQPPPPVVPGDAEPPAPVAVGVVRGRIKDETGTPIPGVRVCAFDPAARALVAITTTDDNGDYLLSVRAGTKVQITPVAMGLRVASSAPRGALDLDFVMTIDAEPQTITVGEGRVLSFRIDNSMWPEYLPPPEVRTWLHFAYGIDPSFYRRCPSMAFFENPVFRGQGPPGTGAPTTIHCPPSVLVHTKKLPKFWWLRVLQRPPNTARVGGGIEGPPAGSPAPNAPSAPP